jgi:excisionase family DNA binding protein
MDNTVLERDVQELERSLKTKSERVNVSLSREAASLTAKMLKAKADGYDVIVPHRLDEVSTTEAALMLGVSRPQIYRLLEKGLVPYRMVGSHRRIPAEALRAWQAAEESRRSAALDRLADLQNELGLV